MKYIMAFDAGTTSNRAIIFDRAGDIVAMSQQEFPQIYPQAGWVEHDPMDIWATQSGVAQQVLARSGIKAQDIAAIGITNQRETAVIWEKETGRPIMNAVVWQDIRTTAICEELQNKGLEDYIRENTGLVIDPYFSGTKIQWMLDTVPQARKRAEQGELLFGTIDTWLIWNLTGEHVTDYSNASRTMIFNIKTREWDEKLLNVLDIPRAMLPQVCPSGAVYGYTKPTIFGDAKIPVAAAIGDQQGALFGQACFSAGMAKNTYGTGSFILMNTGEEHIASENGLLTTIAWGLDDTITYALEGSVFMAGAAVQWLRDELRLIHHAEDTAYYSEKVSDTNGVYMVPAFVGLGAPYWDPYARGIIVGLTRGVNRNHIIRATMEALAYQTCDILSCMEKDSGVFTTELKVDGGACGNDFLMQFQADVLGINVLRPKIVESTARGSAFLAGLATGYWKNREEIASSFQLERNFAPTMSEEERGRKLQGWHRAVDRSQGWVDDND